RRLGDPVEALWVTSGVHGDPRGRADPGAYVALRRAEAEAAAATLGLGATEFWGYPDSMVVTEADLAAVTERLFDRIARTRPDVIYAPHPQEAHSDHHFTALAAIAAHRRALAEVGGYRGHVLGYEVWSACDPHWAVDVGSTYATKLAAIRCYASQLEHNDIPRMIDGLNRFRAVLLPPGGLWAEAFVELGGDGA
ncbi:MAG TPA: PIG-L family deacetylase, partial [Planctomycetota bacterium]|nr:PIG-L family deacetylase [Planctomycetota bacterium]